jgi:hypothetical protein
MIQGCSQAVAAYGRESHVEAADAMHIGLFSKLELSAASYWGLCAKSARTAYVRDWAHLFNIADGWAGHLYDPGTACQLLKNLNRTTSYMDVRERATGIMQQISNAGWGLGYRCL